MEMMSASELNSLIPPVEEDGRITPKSITAIVDDGPTPLLSPASSSTSEEVHDDVPDVLSTSLIATEDIASLPHEPELEHICYVCRRRLGSAEMLKKHEELSSLHEKNLRLLKQAGQRRRADLRADILRARHLGSSEMEKEIEQLEIELADSQEEFERRFHACEAVADSAVVADLWRLEIAGLTWTGNKPTNEDRMVLKMDLGQTGVVGCLVADGHCGDFCADYLVEHLSVNIRHFLDVATAPPRDASPLGTSSSLKRSSTSLAPSTNSPPRFTAEQVSHALTEGFRKTDDEYLKVARLHQIPAGSTAVVCLIFPVPSTSFSGEHDLQCITAHVGDSRALFLSPSGTVTRLTEDHKPDRPDEKERLTIAGGCVVDVGGIWRVFTPTVVCIGGRSLQWGLAVSRAFGDLALKQGDSFIVSAEPEISPPTKLSDGSTIVLACDGIFDVMTDDATGECAAGGPAHIIRTAYSKLSDDNLTALVVKVTRLSDGGEEESHIHKKVKCSPNADECNDEGLETHEEHRDAKGRFSTASRVSCPELITPSQQLM